MQSQQTFDASLIILMAGGLLGIAILTVVVIAVVLISRWRK